MKNLAFIEALEKKNPSKKVDNKKGFQSSKMIRSQSLKKKKKEETKKVGI